MVIRSSSAALGITIALAETGMISFPAAAAFVLGENIGTTVTAEVASIEGGTNAKRAAHAHTLFNVIGAMWIAAIFPVYISVMGAVAGTDPGASVAVAGEQTFPYIRRGLALTHTGFNVVNNLLFLPFLPSLANLVCRIVPEQKKKETPHLTFLDVRMPNVPAFGTDASHKEVVKMGEYVRKMLSWLRDILTSNEMDEQKAAKVLHREEILDVVQKEVTRFVGRVLSGRVASNVTKEARMQLRIADEYESVSDYIAKVLKLYLKKQKAGITFSDEGWRDILVLHDKVQAYIELVSKAVEEERPEVLSKARVQGKAITHQMKESRERHLTRLETARATPLASLIFTDMLTAYRRIKDHGLNIAEVVAGEK
jgi:phosphate:Na+ symporter